MTYDKNKIPKSGRELLELEERLATYEGEDRIITSHEIAETLKQTSDSVFSFSTGVPSLDRILNNVESGELIIVTGPTGHGKTTLLMSITRNMVKRDYKSVWFTLEVTPRQFIKKLLKPNSELPLFYMPAKNLDNNIKWLLERIIEAKVKYDVKVVFIDHLHQIFSMDRMKGVNLSLEIGDIVAGIKQIAIEHNLVIFMVAHNTDNKIARKAEPQIIDIRDSGMISRLADVVMGIWRIPNSSDGKKSEFVPTEEYDTRAKVRVWKNRREGTLGYFVMNHHMGGLVELDLNMLDTNPVPYWAQEKEDPNWFNGK